MSLPGFASYAMQRGTPGTAGSNQFSNQNFPPLESNNAGNYSIESALPMQQSSPYNVNVSVPPSEQPKRKRGRPKKYGNVGTDALALSPSSTVQPSMTPSSTPEKGRRRPAGNGKYQHLASLGDWQSRSAWTGFTPHVITIAIGEDIATKIMSFSQQGSRAICILSANGSVSTATLQRPSISGGIFIYKGHFKILCLSGSYVPTPNSDSCSHSGGINISLANHDGRVFGGVVGDTLIAASHIQVIAGSFLWRDNTSMDNDNEIKDTEGTDGTHIEAVENSVTPTSQHRNLTSSRDVWPGSRSVNTRNSHADFDLMRG